jgi:hypothetical protein
MNTKSRGILLTLAGVGIVVFTTILVFFLFHYFKFYFTDYNTCRCPYRIYAVYYFNIKDYLKFVFSNNFYILLTNIIAFLNIILFYILLKMKQFHLARGIIFSLLALIITFLLIRFL